MQRTVFYMFLHESSYMLWAVFTCPYMFLHVLGKKVVSLDFGAFFKHFIESRDLMSQVKNHQSSRKSPGKNVHLNSAIARVTARLWSSRQRNEYYTIQDDHVQARHAKERRTKQLSLGNGKKMELKLIKNDEEL